MKLSTKVLLVALVLGVVLIAGAVWAYALSGDVIYVCLGPADQVRIAKNPSDCKSKETALECSEGPQQPPGVLGFYQADSGGTTVYPGSGTSAYADCDPGDLVTGGGFTTEAPGQMRYWRSHPYDLDTWGVTVSNEYALELDFWAYAVCADFYPPHQK